MKSIACTLAAIAALSGGSIAIAQDKTPAPAKPDSGKPAAAQPTDVQASQSTAKPAPTDPCKGLEGAAADKCRAAAPLTPTAS